MSFNLGRSVALNGVHHNVDDAVEHQKNLPNWHPNYNEDFDEAEFRAGWDEVSQSMNDVLDNAEGKATANGCDFGD